MSNNNIFNLKQSLIELIADWLDKDEVIIDIIFADLEYPERDSDVHVLMAVAALKVLIEKQFNVGDSDYAEHKIQPWDIWEEYNLNPWEADIIKRVLRKKKGTTRTEDLEKIKHICDHLIYLESKK